MKANLETRTDTNGRRGILSLVFAAAALAGCAQTVDNLPPLPQESFPQPGYTALPPYRVQVGDVLSLKLILNPELNEEVVVRPDGKISTTVAQDVQAFGRTPAEITGDLRNGYRGTLRD